MQSLQTPPAQSTTSTQPTKPATKPGSSKGAKFADAMLITFFIGLILYFGVGTWTAPPEAVSEDENRTLAPMPKWPPGKPRWRNIVPLPMEFDAWASDRVPGRTFMVKAWNWLLYAGLHVSPGNTIAIGKDNWLYFLGDGSESVIRHEKPFSDVEMSEWKKVLTYRTKELEKHGIRYMFVSTPNKDSVYPEYLPEVWKPIHPESRMHQLAASFKNDPVVTFLDTTDGLNKRKGGPILFYKTDTHWNAYGGIIGYRDIMLTAKKWFPQVEPISEDQIYYDHVPHIKGDCVKMLGLYGWIVDDAPVARIKGAANENPELLQPIDVSGKDRATGVEQAIPIFYNAPGKINKLVFIHDSFGDGIKSYMAGHFNQIVEMRQDDISFDMEKILALKPDLVIQEAVERHIAQFTPSMTDWRVWAVQTIQKVEPKEGNPVWLNIVPCTHEVNVTRFIRVPRHHGRMINPTSPRQYSERGDQVEFDPNKALYFEWYVLKDGEQGTGLRDPQSEKNYNALCDFVRNSGKFEKVSEMNMLDRSALTLWRQKH